MVVIKRDGREVEFSKEKIVNAVSKAFISSIGKNNTKIAEKIANEIEVENSDKDKIDISTIEKMVYEKLISNRHRNVARTYEGYRAVREY